jgi:CheY-like chemotaxis protein/anti-sigma regulatory factor (Ser/Thr protein kinase)
VAKQLLVVDDDPAIGELIDAMLAGSEWSPEFVESGELALARLGRSDYDVILTDILMPGMDGLALLAKIHEKSPGSPVVMMTAWNTPDNIIGSLEGHAVNYLAKPFTKASLLDTLAAAISAEADAGDIEVLSAKPDWISVRVRCKLSVCSRLTQFFRELPPDVDAGERDAVATGFRELLMNAIEHGGHCDPTQTVDLSYIRTARALVYYIRDPGEGFCIDNLPHAAISHPEDPMAHAAVRAERGIRAGGFGLLMTKNFADELIYSARGNEVVLIKHL